MTDTRDAERLHRKLDHYGRLLPAPVGRSLYWIRHETVPWVRIPLAILLLLGGVFSFLPLLGAWMIPLGLLLLAIDVPALQRPVLGTLVKAERAWVRMKRRRTQRREERVEHARREGRQDPPPPGA